MKASTHITTPHSAGPGRSRIAKTTPPMSAWTVAAMPLPITSEDAMSMKRRADGVLLVGGHRQGVAEPRAKPVAVDQQVVEHDDPDQGSSARNGAARWPATRPACRRSPPIRTPPVATRS